MSKLVYPFSLDAFKRAMFTPRRGPGVEAVLTRAGYDVKTGSALDVYTQVEHDGALYPVLNTERTMIDALMALLELGLPQPLSHPNYIPIEVFWESRARVDGEERRVAYVTLRISQDLLWVTADFWVHAGGRDARPDAWGQVYAKLGDAEAIVSFMLERTKDLNVLGLRWT